MLTSSKICFKMFLHLPSGLPCDLFVGSLLLNLSWLLSQERKINKMKFQKMHMEGLHFL